MLFFRVSIHALMDSLSNAYQRGFACSWLLLQLGVGVLNSTSTEPGSNINKSKIVPPLVSSSDCMQSRKLSGQLEALTKDLTLASVKLEVYIGGFMLVKQHPNIL